MNQMQHQYWVTKKCVLQKLGTKEDACIVSSDAELDAKLELFKSVADNCVQLLRCVDNYQEKIANLSHEENNLGKYLKDSGKNEKNANAGQLLTAAGKALSYVGHQRMSLRVPLLRLHHEVETFRNRAVTDSKVTISEMEKARTEYRAALLWMKSTSSQLDPEAPDNMEKFRRAQAQVRMSKARFDRLMLACLQKVDLLAAARCNMFSHALLLYQNAVRSYCTKAADTLTQAALVLGKQHPVELLYNTSPTTSTKHDQDKKTFFKAEYSDSANTTVQKDNQNAQPSTSNSTEPKEAEEAPVLLIEADGIDQPPVLESSDVANDLSTLLNWQASGDLLGDFLPSHLLQNDQEIVAPPAPAASSTSSSTSKPTSQTSAVSWLSLFADLDPLANSNGSV